MQWPIVKLMFKFTCCIMLNICYNYCLVDHTDFLYEGNGTVKKVLQDLWKSTPVTKHALVILFFLQLGF